MESNINMPSFPENGITCEYIQENLFHLVYGKMTEQQVDIVIIHIQVCEPCKRLFATEYEFRNIFCSMTDDCKICPESIKSRLEIFLGDPNFDKVAETEFTEEKIEITQIEALDRLVMDSKVSHRTKLLSILKDELTKFTEDEHEES